MTLTMAKVKFFILLPRSPRPSVLRASSRPRPSSTCPGPVREAEEEEEAGAGTLEVMGVAVRVVMLRAACSLTKGRAGLPRGGATNRN